MPKITFELTGRELLILAGVNTGPATLSFDKDGETADFKLEPSDSLKITLDFEAELENLPHDIQSEAYDPDQRDA